MFFVLLVFFYGLDLLNREEFAELERRLLGDKHSRSILIKIFNYVL